MLGFYVIAFSPQANNNYSLSFTQKCFPIPLSKEKIDFMIKTL